jgi:hypothetical protein
MSTELIRPRAATAALLVLAAVVATGIALTAVAFGALALGADSAFMPLQPGPYLTFGIVGVLAAIAGWVLVVRFVRQSARLLRILVPALVLVTLIPDVMLLIGGFIPGTTVVGVVALMLMHVIVAAIAVFVGQRIAPAR